MMGTSQVRRIRTDRDRLRLQNTGLSSPPPFSTYLFRSLLEPFVQTTMDWTTDMAATVAGIIKQITGLK